MRGHISDYCNSPSGENGNRARGILRGSGRLDAREKRVLTKRTRNWVLGHKAPPTNKQLRERRGKEGGFRPIVFALTHRHRNYWRAVGHRQKKLRGETSISYSMGTPTLPVFMDALA